MNDDEKRNQEVTCESSKFDAQLTFSNDMAHFFSFHTHSLVSTWAILNLLTCCQLESVKCVDVCALLVCKCVYTP